MCCICYLGIIIGCFSPILSYIYMYQSNKISTSINDAGTSQGFLAKWLGVSIKTVQAWELGTNIPNGPSARLLSLLEDGKICVDMFVVNK